MKKIVLIFAFILTGNIINANTKKNQIDTLGIKQDLYILSECEVYASEVALNWETPGTDAYNNLYNRMYGDCINGRN